MGDLVNIRISVKDISTASAIIESRFDEPPSFYLSSLGVESRKTISMA